MGVSKVIIPPHTGISLSGGRSVGQSGGRSVVCSIGRSVRFAIKSAVRGYLSTLVIVLVSIATLLVMVLTHRTVAHNTLIRKTSYGFVQGFSTNLAQVFYGIPYAAPAQRWTAPTDPVSWPDILDAQQVKPMCYQGNSCSGRIPIDCIPQESEDCLFLNVFAPLNTMEGSDKAVMFFLHGGGFDDGTGGARVYNAEMVAKKGNVVVVTINYRLGAFGFLVTGTTSNDITGNYGLMDQRLALKWVHENIKHFGGNPNKVTIFGQSAGALSVAIHMLSGKVDHYFHRAILQSVPWSIPLKPLDVAVSQGLVFGQLATCQVDPTTIDSDCLRALQASDIATIQKARQMRVFADSALRQFTQWVPHIDGDEVKSEIIQGLTTDPIFPKPVMIGVVADEAFFYIDHGFSSPVPAKGLPTILSLFAPNLPGNALDLYPVADITDAREELALLSTDYVFNCPTRLIAAELSKRMPVYAYVFDDVLSFNYLVFDEALCGDRVCHGTDVGYVFQSARVWPLTLDNDELALSDIMIAYWTNFAKCANPNHRLVNGIKWRRYTTKGKKSNSTIRLTTPEVSNQRGYRSEFCDVLDLSGYM